MQRKLKNNKRQRTKTNKSFISDKNSFKTADSNCLSTTLSQLRRSNRHTTNNERKNSSPLRNDRAISSLNSAKNTINNVSEIDAKEAFKKSRNKRTSLKTDASNNLPQEQICNSQKSIITRSGSVLIRNDPAVSSLSSAKKTDSNVSEINIKETFKKPKNKQISLKMEACNNFPQQQICNSQESIVTRSGSVLTRNDLVNTSVKKILKKPKKIQNNKGVQNTNKKSRFLSDKNNFETPYFVDISQQQAFKTQEIVNTKNSFISGGNDLASTSVKSPEHSAKISQVNNKKQRKIKYDKNRHMQFKNSCKDQQLSKAKGSEKSKSCSSKNNLHNAHKQLNPSVPVRRSTRQRFAPFATWRNERLRYRFENGEIKIIGIDKGTEEDISFVQALQNRLYRNKKQKNNKKIMTPKMLKVYDWIENTEKVINPHKKIDEFPWYVRVDENSEFGFKYNRMISLGHNNFGHFLIDAGKMKPLELVPGGADLHLTVVTGKLQIEIQNSVFIAESKDMLVVPGGNTYSIKNIGTTKARLIYAAGRFNYLLFEGL